ncbi:MAG: hypothetical protein ABI682_12415 [Acidobacteriota bacterium]
MDRRGGRNPSLLERLSVAAGRSLAPCILSHFTINALAEPGLVLAALRGEMARPAADADAAG